MRIKWFITPVIILLTSNVEAVVGSNWLHIKQVNLGYDYKRVSLIMDAEIPNPFQCNTYTKEAQADENLVHVDYVLSTALMAFAANKEVKLLIAEDECSAGGRPRIISIQVR